MDVIGHPEKPNERASSNLVLCEDCNGKVSRKAVTCPHCGRPFGRAASPTVTLSDVDIGFFSLVGLMVKVAVAAIPATIILSVIFVALMAILGGGMGMFGGGMRY